MVLGVSTIAVSLMEPSAHRRIEPLPLVVALALPLTVGALGGAATASSVRTWYPTLRKPPFNPPAWLFGPVWTVLYLSMGVAMYLVWTEGRQDLAHPGDFAFLRDFRSTFAAPSNDVLMFKIAYWFQR